MSPLRSYLRRNAPGLFFSLLAVLAVVVQRVGENRAAIERGCQTAQRGAEYWATRVQVTAMMAASW
jgi:hypothetical protein